MSFAVPIVVNGGDTGLSLLATVVGLDNKIVAGYRNISGFFEYGGGSYSLVCNAADDQRGCVIVHIGATDTDEGDTWDGSGVTEEVGSIPITQELENADVKISSRGTAQNADVQTLLTRLSSSRAGYLDNLNVGGAVASHADIAAINIGTRHISIVTLAQYERPESGNIARTIEVRTYNALDGSAVDADDTPTLTATGSVSGSLAANLASPTNPATGVYQWEYTVAHDATQEQIRFDISAAIASATFTLATYTQVIDEVSATWTSTDASHLTAIYDKLPTNNIADQTLLNASIGSPMQTNGIAGGVVGLNVSLIDAAVSSRAIPGDLMNLEDSAITSAKFSVDSTSGYKTGLLERIRKVTNRFLNKRVGPKTANGIMTQYADDGVTAESTQVLSTDTSNITQEAES